ncbi:transcription elongation factor GreA [Thermoclostridium stercorarium subsp. stercorarium DSM 8532]|jgi:transcription elongation factor GreA|uniref:Transcription elongation factor GreA n=3 Tax=Thermoclostridium stercorarium TaxID=1510 RepID=L7VSM7_THES1|nr:transcription elongation factor GreA [Thermoclostridium stercorarium]AGC69376.1 transcription elongation factor GreA [Thermoclostridium stercorarium subsp. stercorarium DSM 8532]AGI40336.1 GreA [Thermoclostridium stercorarium subsp. stercorarium DSM 8532]ANW99630.1 transcription elongation factor GreA [Thermoclostridium stercorarium subsp. thermolacticum DSM 2910]ANX02257.1 transcription elongation factor GreA [Thermoclostridium stercorarium subsp. leptospartum DSM 9219]UZQ85334.1 transcrip
MSGKEIYLTYEGLKKLEEELERLKGEKRKEIAERIKQALAFGDISENSEYDEAKSEQAKNEMRIAQLENMLKNAVVIDEDEVDTNSVRLGTRVKVYDMDLDEEMDYYIVGSTEADPLEQKISNDSPVGRALMGKKPGDIVTVQVPDGVVRLKVLEIYK